MKFYDIDQSKDRDEWLQMRVGKIGGSSVGKIMANFGKSFGDPAQKYAVDIALERITGKGQESGFMNDHMLRGIEQEPIARALYEQEYFVNVLNGGFFDAGNVGVSLDGLVDQYGAIEIKSVIPSTHCKCVSRNSYDPSYKWQLYLNLKISEREWIDYVSFCSEFPINKRLFVFRIIKNCKETEDNFAKIDTRLAEFEELVVLKTSIINNA